LAGYPLCNPLRSGTSQQLKQKRLLFIAKSTDKKKLEQIHFFQASKKGKQLFIPTGGGKAGRQGSRNELSL
jgi:hypothetical protein